MGYKRVILSYWAVANQEKLYQKFDKTKTPNMNSRLNTSRVHVISKEIDLIRHYFAIKTNDVIIVHHWKIYHVKSLAKNKIL